MYFLGKRIKLLRECHKNPTPSFSVLFACQKMETSLRLIRLNYVKWSFIICARRRDHSLKEEVVQIKIT